MERREFYRLRPHHGMCLAYFEGKGYSDTFSVHMTEMLEILENGAQIRLTVAGDEICSACPNLKNDVCSTATLVASYDQAVLQLCGFQENEILSFQEFVSAVEEKILKSGRREEICGGCQWNSICRRNRSRWTK